MRDRSLRGILRRLLGIPEIRPELAPEKRGELDAGEIVIEKWLFTAEPRSRIPLNLYRPRKAVGRIPALVMTCGHGDSKSVPHMTYVARTYARAGVAALLADPLGEEERHAEGRMGTRAHDASDVAYLSELAGRPIMGKLVFDVMRALDFLETLDWVDAGRLGVAGNSLGGAVAGWVFALDRRVRLTLVSGWAFSDVLCRTSKHCTRVPNQRLRAVCEWPEFLAMGAEHSALLVMNGDADVVIDQDRSGTVWRDSAANLDFLQPPPRLVQIWSCPGGGHRPYQGTRRALQFIREQLGTPGMSQSYLSALGELNYGEWCDRHRITLEPLYGTPLHYRGAALPDLGFVPIPHERLAVLTPAEVGGADFTVQGWLEQTARR